MTNTLRSIAALLTPALVLACTLLSACAAPQAARPAAPTLEQIAKADAAYADALCDEQAERDSDLWWECNVATNTRLCEAHGWCGDELGIVAETHGTTTTIALTGNGNRCGIILDGTTLRSAGCE